MKHGIPPTLAISALVPRVAAKTVADLVYSAEEIDASSAFAAGLISRVVPDGELDAPADRFLDSLRQYDVTAIRVFKGCIVKAWRFDPDESDIAARRGGVWQDVYSSVIAHSVKRNTNYH